jgi:hypothetical protein
VDDFDGCEFAGVVLAEIDGSKPSGTQPCEKLIAADL